jgi:predicted ATPase
MTRIDRLADDTKRLLQTAAVVGREIPLGLLAALWQANGLVDHLAELTRQEFLFERTDTDTPTYVFKHALTRDVTYRSLLTAHRQTLHAAAAHALEALFAGRLDQVSDQLAYHYAESTVATKAVEYLTRQAEKPG